MSSEEHSELHKSGLNRGKEGLIPLSTFGRALIKNKNGVLGLTSDRGLFLALLG